MVHAPDLAGVSESSASPAHPPTKTEMAAWKAFCRERGVIVPCATLSQMIDGQRVDTHLHEFINRRRENYARLYGHWAGAQRSELSLTPAKSGA